MKFFDQKIKIKYPGKSKFDLSHEKKLSLNMGELVPILVQEVLPGDSFRKNTETMMRLAPMLAPMMHRVNVYIHDFFVPTRTIWDEHEKFIVPTPSSSPVMPTMTYAQGVNLGGTHPWSTGSLIDYMGIPPYDLLTLPTETELLTVLPLRAYHKIYWEYFADENLSGTDPKDYSSGPQTDGQVQFLLTLRKRAWEKDYYTSALTEAQKGAPISIPFTYKDSAQVSRTDGTLLAQDSPVTTGAGRPAPLLGDGGAILVDNIDHLATINEFREANAIQRFLEKLNRAGSRYTEYLKMVWGAKSADARLQRAEFLGGSRQPIVISEVLSTFDNTAADLPQGTMTGHGISVGSSNNWSQNFTEHGYIISILSVIPRTGYQQGLEKMWSRLKPYDFAIPDFAHLGEQAVLNKEVYFDANDLTPGANDLTFGYQSRFAEYKFKNATSHGDFRTSLAFWHMDRVFASRPNLNASFIESDPTYRIFAIEDPTLDHLWVQIYHSISAVRCLPYNGTPTIGG
ncbi:MAG: major capsid protein [Microvirus sp.]|nr:MAG: major capsid protein [Microvirus sp.]